MQEPKLIAKAMTRLDAKAEKMNPKSGIKMARMIKTYMSLTRKPKQAVRLVMPIGTKDSEYDKMTLDMIKWAESSRKSRYGRTTQNPMCRGKRRFLAGITMNYRCA